MPSLAFLTSCKESLGWDEEMDGLAPPQGLMSGCDAHLGSIWWSLLELFL